MNITVEKIERTVKVNVITKNVIVSKPENNIVVNRVGRKGEKGDQGARGPKGEKGDPGDPATNLVTSVNGKQGVVVLDNTDVAADASGAATQALADAKAYTDQEVGDIDTGVLSVTAGTNVTVDNTDPKNPIVSASGGGGAVDSVNGQTGVVVLDADDVGAVDIAGDTMTGNLGVPTLLLPATTSSTGQIQLDAQNLIHAYHGASATAHPNYFIGENSGNFTTDSSGPSTQGTGNIGIGKLTLNSLTTGYYNVALGNQAGQSLTTGYGNVFFGHEAGYSMTTGTHSLLFGRNAGRLITTGTSNVALGPYALNNLVSGGNNTAVGRFAGSGALGSGNVFLGYNAGFAETGSNKLYIANSSTATPLIGGDFSANTVTINGTLTATNLSGTNTGDQDLSGYALTSSLATVATSGDYDDLTDKPTIPDELTDLDTTVTGSQLNSMKSKLDNIEANADVTDSANVQASLPSGTNGQVLKHNGTSWAAGTDNNTTYSEISESEITTGTATTTRSITGRRAGFMTNRANHTGSQAISTVTNLQTTLDAKEALANKSTTTTLGTSDTLYPTQNAVKSYVDTTTAGIVKARNLGFHPFLNVVSNTTAETNLHSAYTLPANTIIDSYLSNLSVNGVLLNDSGSSCNYTIRIKIGSLTWQTYTFTMPTNANQVAWCIDTATACIDFLGLRLVGAGTLNVGNPAGGTDTAVITQQTSTDIIDFTTSKQILATVQMSVANANTSCNAFSGYIDVSNPA